jgi:bis(5'-nucleosidyl)-tetraphosphatase
MLRVYRYWDFPKGMVEPDEAPFRAAIRELKEETGLEQVTFPWGDQFYETEPYAHGKVARYYVGQVDKREVTLVPNPITGLVEHHEFRWFGLEEARRVLVPRVASALEWAVSQLDSETISESKAL